MSSGALASSTAGSLSSDLISPSSAASSPTAASPGVRMSTLSLGTMGSDAATHASSTPSFGAFGSSSLSASGGSLLGPLTVDTPSAAGSGKAIGRGAGTIGKSAPTPRAPQVQIGSLADPSDSPVVSAVASSPALSAASGLDDFGALFVGAGAPGGVPLTSSGSISPAPSLGGLGGGGALKIVDTASNLNLGGKKAGGASAAGGAGEGKTGKSASTSSTHSLAAALADQMIMEPGYALFHVAQS